MKLTVVFTCFLMLTACGSSGGGGSSTPETSVSPIPIPDAPKVAWNFSSASMPVSEDSFPYLKDALLDVNAINILVSGLYSGLSVIIPPGVLNEKIDNVAFTGFSDQYYMFINYDYTNAVSEGSVLNGRITYVYERYPVTKHRLQFDGFSMTLAGEKLSLQGSVDFSTPGKQKFNLVVGFFGSQLWLNQLEIEDIHVHYPARRDVAVNGALLNSDRGRIDISTQSPLVNFIAYDDNNVSVDYGGAMIFKGDNSSALLTGLNRFFGAFALDANGTQEYTHGKRFAWDENKTRALGVKQDLQLVANAGRDTALKVGDNIVLNGLFSHYNDVLLSYTWELIFAPEASNLVLAKSAAAMLPFSPDVIGDYVFKLTASTEDSSTIDYITITAEEHFYTDVAYGGGFEIYRETDSLIVDTQSYTNIELGNNWLKVKDPVVRSPINAIPVTKIPNSFRYQFVPSGFGLYGFSADGLSQVKYISDSTIPFMKTLGFYAADASLASFVLEGDINGDGTKTLLYGDKNKKDAHNNTQIVAMYNQGKARSQKLNSLPIPVGNNSYYLADVDGDGKDDLVALSLSANEQIFFLNVVAAESSFRTGGLFGCDIKPYGKGTLTSSGRASILVMEGCNYQLYSLGLNDTNTKMIKTPLLVDGEPLMAGNGVYIADFNGDGLSDILIERSSEKKFHFLENQGNGSFLHASSFALLGDDYYDSNFDSVIAIAALDDATQGIIFKQKNTYKLARVKRDYTVAVTELGVMSELIYPGDYGAQAADINQDGLKDIIINNNRMAVVFLASNKAEGKQFNAPYFLQGDFPFALQLFDIDGNGALDIVSARGTGHVFDVWLLDKISATEH